MSGVETKAAFPRHIALDALNCPSCGGVVKLRAAGHAVAAVCSHCGTVIDTTGSRAVLGKVALASEWDLCVEVGTDLRLDGRKWRCVGAARRVLQDKTFLWEEYLLHNPFYGFRWLVYNAGYFYLGKRVNSLPTGIDVLAAATGEATFLGNAFLHYDSCLASYELVVGEFYWQVKTGDDVAMSDYVETKDGALMLSIEADAAERNVTLLKWVSRSEVAPYLNPKRHLSIPSEPSPLRVASDDAGEPPEKQGVVIAFTLVAVCLLFFFRHAAATANAVLYILGLWFFFLKGRTAGDRSKKAMESAHHFFAKAK